jgi:salicylate hydroxylase
MVTYPLRGGAFVNIVAVQEREAWAEEGWSHQDDPSNLRQAFADFGTEPRGLLDRVEDVRLWGLFRHPVARHWHAPGVALIGDAAHPTLPFLAQGANMAMEDVWALVACHSGSAAQGRDALERYQTLRAARVKKVIATANRNAWRYHLSFPPLRAAAHLGLRLTSTLAPRFMLSQFDWLYRYDITQASSSTQTGT